MSIYDDNVEKKKNNRLENCKSRSDAIYTIMKILGYTSIGKFACDIDFDKSNLSKIIRNEKDIITFIQADKIIYQTYPSDEELKTFLYLCYKELI